MPAAAPPETIEFQWIDPASGLLADAGCADAVQLPFIAGSAPRGAAPCRTGKNPLSAPVDWFKELFQ
jgi:penicillin-binding protein 1B